MNDFLGQLSGPVVDAAVMIVTVLLAAGVNYLRIYINERVQNEQMKADLLKTTAVADAKVGALIGALSSDLKQKLVDGKLTKAEMSALQDTAVTNLKEALPDVEERLSTHITNSSKYLADIVAKKLESANKVTGI